jgi:hypothetical protein
VIISGFTVALIIGQKPKTVCKTITFRKYKELDNAKFEEDLQSSDLSTILTMDSVTDAVATYNKGLAELFDKHVPSIYQNCQCSP